MLLVYLAIAGKGSACYESASCNLQLRYDLFTLFQVADLSSPVDDDFIHNLTLRQFGRKLNLIKKENRSSF